MERDLGRVAQIYEEFKIPCTTLYRWNREKRFPGLFWSIGNILFVDRNRLRELIKEAQGRDGER
jgi:hypothetical protein